MFCKKCGVENTKNAIYCVNDGVLLKPVAIENASIFEESSFCKVCGTHNLKHSNYCYSCGNTFMKQGELKTIDLPLYDNAKKALGTKPSLGQMDFNVPLFKIASKGAIMAMALVTLLSIFISLLANTAVNEIIAELISSELGLPIQFGTFEMIRFNDVLLMTHMIGSEMGISSYGEVGVRMSMKAGLYLLLLVPFLGLFIAGVRIRKKHAIQSFQEKAFLSLSLAAVYTLMLLLISVFSTMTQSLSSYYVDIVTFRLSYSFWGTLFNGFALSAIFSYVGMSKRDSLKLEQWALPVNTGITSLFKIYFVSFVIIVSLIPTLLLISNVSGIVILILALMSILAILLRQLLVYVNTGVMYRAIIYYVNFIKVLIALFVILTVIMSAVLGSELVGSVIISFLILGQLPVYVMSILNLGSIQFMIFDNWSGVERMSVNLFSHMDVYGEIFSNRPLLIILPIIAFLLQGLVFVLAGRKIKANSALFSLNELGVFSFVYAGLLSLISFFGRVTFNATEAMGNIVFGFSLSINSLILFVLAFLLAFGFSFIGSKTIGD